MYMYDPAGYGPPLASKYDFHCRNIFQYDNFLDPRLAVSVGKCVSILLTTVSFSFSFLLLLLVDTSLPFLISGGTFPVLLLETPAALTSKVYCFHCRNLFSQYDTFLDPDLAVRLEDFSVKSPTVSFSSSFPPTFPR